MKEKIAMFVIGVLVGAVLATGAFYLFGTSNDCSSNVPSNGERREKASGENGKPPEKPSGENGGPSGIPNEEPPQKPEDSNTEN